MTIRAEKLKHFFAPWGVSTFHLRWNEGVQIVLDTSTRSNGLSYYNTGSGQVPYTTYTNYNTGSYNPTYKIEMDSIWNTDDDELGVITIV